MRLIDADKLRKDILDMPNCYNGFSDTYDKAMILDMIDEQPSIDGVSRWIPVTERLPEAYQPVMRTVKRLCWEDGTGFGTWLDVDIGTYNTNDGNIVAWMPLPKPYEAERKES